MTKPSRTKSRRVGVTSTMGVFSARYAAEHLLDEITSDFDQNYSLIPSYIAAFCMGLEGQINSILIEHFFEAVGAKYKQIIKPLLMLNIRDRFSVAVVLASEYRYELNKEDPRVIELFKLFELRNRVVHVKQHRKIGSINRGEEGISITIDDPDPSDPYGPEQKWKVDSKTLRAWMSLFNYWVPRLSFLGTNIKRKQFNPSPDFLAIVHELPSHRRKRRARES